MDTAAFALPVGTLLQDGAFTIGQVLGRGGFGITYAGSDVKLQRLVAIKEFFPEGSTRRPDAHTASAPANWAASQYEAARDRFLREGQTLARFDHPGIVRVFGLFEENGTAYMVMEYLKGQSLQQLVDGRRVLPEEKAIAYSVKVAAALDEVHRADLLHRDVKPENIIIGDDGRVTLIDFGLTKAVEKTTTLHGTRQLAGTTHLGTPAYAPLEQYTRQNSFGAATDVYALGATLYHLLTGEPPIPATDRANGTDLLPPAQVNPHVSHAISRAVMWAMQMKAAERPQSMRAFAEALRSGVAVTAPATTKQVQKPPPPAARPVAMEPMTQATALVAAPACQASAQPVQRAGPQIVTLTMPRPRRGTVAHAVAIGATRGGITGLVGGLLLGLVIGDWAVPFLVALIGALGGAAVGIIAARRPRYLSGPPQPPSLREAAGALLQRTLMGAVKGGFIGAALGTVAALILHTPLDGVALGIPTLEGAIGGAVVSVISKQLQDGLRREPIE